MDEVEDFPDAVHAAFDTELDALRWLYSNALETDSHATGQKRRLLLLTHALYAELICLICCH